MKDNRDQKKKSPLPSIIAIVFALALINSELLGVMIVLGALAGVVYLGFRAGKRNSTPSEKPPVRQSSFDECPSTICFHKDKGEHHVRQGKEIDPWDRPDIDISKYQRRS